MFRRNNPTAEAEQSTLSTKQGGKGRPTPKRREAEAARRNKTVAPKDRKQAKAKLREERVKERQRVAEALQTGDERHYPARDQGKARRIARNWIDGRRNIGEVFWPLVITALVLLIVPVPVLQSMSTILLLGFYFLVMADTAWSLSGLRRVLQENIPEPSERRGALPYAFGRSLQSRKRRRPIPQVERGWTSKLRRGDVKADQTKSSRRD